MSTNPEQDALRERWALEARIPLSGVADGAVWRRARSVSTGEDVVLFIVRGEAALEAADAVRRAYLVEDPHLLPVREIVVLDDPREESEDPAGHTAEEPTGEGPTTVVEYPMPPAPPLAALLTGGPLHPETARAIIGEAATGLEVARRRGVRHQFLDSNRVFVDTRSGTVTILGIGVEAASHPGLDRSREVASFQDTAALVALLYRALTGRTPQHDAGGTVPRPSTLVDTEIPADLDLLCDLVLNESAEDIPETTRGLIEALEPWQSIPVTFEAYARTSADAGTAQPEEPTQEIRQPAQATEAPGGEEPEPDSSETEEPGHEVPTSAGADPAGGSAFAVGAAGAAGAAGAGLVADPVGTGASGTSGESESSTSSGDEGPDPSDETSPESAPPAPREDHSVTATELVKDLHLDEKRGSSAFPGHLDITQPTQQGPAPARQDAPAPHPDDQPRPGAETDHDSPGPGTAGAAAAGAAAAGGAGLAAASAGDATAAGSASSSANAQSSPPAEPAPPFPARTSGTHWPLSPARAPEGSGGRAEQPGDAVGAATADHAAPTPTAAPEQTTGPAAQSAEDRPTEMMPAASAPTPAPRETGPIVVQGRRTSLLDETGEPVSSAHSRSSLLRDVVGVAVDADDPDTFALGPRDREKRSLQSQWIIVGGVVIVMVALIFAVTAITRDLRDIISDPLATSQPATTAPPTEEDTGEAPSEPTPTDTEEPEAPAPELSGVEVFTQGSDLPPDNADQQDRMTDGDPETFWSTKHYGSPDFGGLKEGAGVRLTFAEESTLKKVTVTTARNNGGRIELRELNDDGSLGDELASAELAGDGEVLLETPEPLETESVALWIPELPPDSNEQGRYRARIAEIQVG